MSLLHKETLSGAGMWSKVIKRGRTLRLTDLEGGANVGMLLYNAYEKHERYNMPDTLKGQYIFHLKAPYCLHSDMGRLFASITAESSGWHDTVCGASDAKSVKAKYGQGDYQELHNDFHRNAQECFLIELAKWGLGKRDLVPNINWFSKVVPDEEGKLSFIKNHSKPGDCVALRFELDTLVVLNTCPHPFDPNPEYKPRPVELAISEADTFDEEDPSLQVRSENQRAYHNTTVYNTLRF
ncbi:urea amidolyase associated protein UAAP1 [Pelagicoccus sp. SDUM812002]|uniref:urea amidolyase associated protein UAAP1 n=1 Tax=Pelagicoccus sp. SDUM812002 TaxID=3041266 RepID=UPI00280F6785|nr:urea amidolyase associated protein UAAP1 [Pelagicoccus sp. SDUM812002]MDQ8185467.1 urea carboxylase-associated family protein [Pelagicoccus sp. SDUM812002]